MLMAAPNGLRFTRAAPLDRDVVRVHLDAKMATILSTRSGVGCKRGLGGHAGWRWCFAALGRGIRLIRNYATTPILLGAPKPQPVVALRASGYKITE
jgi:hypothetical protein